MKYAQSGHAVACRVDTSGNGHNLESNAKRAVPFEAFDLGD